MPSLRRITAIPHSPRPINRSIPRVMTMRCTGQLDRRWPAEGQQDPAYSDDPYAYHDGYGDAAEEPGQKRRGGLATVMAFWRWRWSAPGARLPTVPMSDRLARGEPPIIKADTSADQDRSGASDEANAKVPDRLATGDGTEKIVPREEAPVDVNAATHVRSADGVSAAEPERQSAVVASVAPNAPPPPNTGNGTCRTTSRVRSRHLPFAATSLTGPPRRYGQRRRPPSRRLQPAPHAAPPQAAPAVPMLQRQCAVVVVAAGCQRRPQPPRNLEPCGDQRAPAVATRRTPAGGGYLVQVSSQRNEADAQASYRVLQGKFPSVLGSRFAVDQARRSRRKGVYYRAMVGPFGSSEEASHFCGSLRTAGGQCVIQRN